MIRASILPPNLFFFFFPPSTQKGGIVSPSTSFFSISLPPHNSRSQSLPASSPSRADKAKSEHRSSSRTTTRSQLGRQHSNIRPSALVLDQNPLKVIQLLLVDLRVRSQNLLRRGRELQVAQDLRREGVLDRRGGSLGCRVGWRGLVGLRCADGLLLLLLVRLGVLLLRCVGWWSVCWCVLGCRRVGIWRNGAVGGSVGVGGG